MLLAGLLAAALLGCSDEADPPDDQEPVTMNVMEARAALEALLLETAEAVAPGVEVEVVSDLPPGQCLSDLTGAVLDTESATLGYALPVDDGTEKVVLMQVVAEWERIEIELDRGQIDDRDAEVVGQLPNLTVRVLAVPDTGQVALTGQTDCLDPAGG